MLLAVVCLVVCLACQNFAREQIRGLVRQVFFANVLRPVRQVVFSPMEAETDVQNLCRRVGQALALETLSSVAVVGGHPLMLPEALQTRRGNGRRQGRRHTKRPCLCGKWRCRYAAISGWFRLWQRMATAFADSRWHGHLCEVRREFEYSIVEGPPAGESSEATAMAQLADGIVLVLSAHHTRRATARSVKQRLEAAQVRLLGTVLATEHFQFRSLSTGGFRGVAGRFADSVLWGKAGQTWGTQ